MHHHHDHRTAALFTSIDAALDGHDLQRSTEHAPGGGTGCVRCSGEPEPGSGFCGPCRAYMLGDLEHDPAPAPLQVADSDEHGQALDDLRTSGWAVPTAAGHLVASPKALQLVSAALQPLPS